MKASGQIRVAQMLARMDYGGIEMVVMNYYRHIDRSKIQFDFIVFEGSKLPQRKEIEELGGRIYEVPSLKNPSAYCRAVLGLFEKNRYDIVHANMNTLSVFPLRMAKKAGIPVRICHNHSTAGPGETKKNILKNILRHFSRIYPNELFACSEYAGRWLYGDKASFRVIKNAIDIGRFRYDEKTRTEIRKKLGIDDKLVLGHVGRFEPQKNHDFLLDIFHSVHQINPETVLLLIGGGELEDQMKKKAEELGLKDSVFFTGTMNDCAPYYQAMDAFVLPSLYEGLGMAAIEAQTAGLPCFLSDRVPEEADFLDSTYTVPLEQKPEDWAKLILEKTTKNKRLDTHLKIQEAGYDIETEAEKLMDIYAELADTEMNVKKYS
ncbi:MAG: glycosyltransferase family 1 protein [Candidatus Weimeria sp.]